ncbi:MAG TPA: glycosyltransferase family 2 protein, partial [Kofleriaceae bacterium]|nr:glycosyltransferase family 2 protein [Kofleriaceae bacterium]
RSQPIAVPRTGGWRRGGADVDLGRWQVVYRLPIEDGWKPGAYLARFETLDGKANQHPFWVTSKRPTTGTVMLASVLSHVAGNRWGRSRAQRLAARIPERARPLLDRLPVPVRQRLHTVRLLSPHNGSRGGRVLLHEVPFLRWAEANKLALDCITDVELHQQPELLTGWQQVVIAGDARCMTRPVLEALSAHRDRGGSIAVLGAAPGEQLVDLDVDAGTVTLGGETPPAALDAELWGAGRGAPADASDLRFLDRALTGGGLAPAAGLCGERTSHTGRTDDDPELLARGPGCDTVLATTPAGGRLFIAGTDRWTWALDDFIDRPVEVSPAVREITARVLGLRGDSYQWEPLVSVIMTAYNSAEHLARAVDSILAQSYRNLELIVVDDASTDGTFQVLLDYAARDGRVRPLRSSRNHGTYWCKNLAITRARGELLTFQDSDDVSDPERLATQVGALRRNPAAVCAMVDYIRVDDTGQVLVNRGRTQRCAIMAPMFRAEPVRARAGFFDSVRGGADQEFYHRLHLAFPDADIIETHQPLYHALARWGSLTRTTDSFVDLGADEAPDRLAHLSPDRRAYVIAYEDWHKKIERGEGTPFMAFPPAERPFPVPARLGVDSGRTQPDLDLDTVPATPAEPLRLVREAGPAAATAWVAPPTLERVDRPGEAAARPRVARGAAYEADVVLLSDFRFPGGTSASNAEEIKAQARGGLTTLLAQVNSPVLRRNHPINPLIKSCVDAGMAEMLPARTPARCKLLVIRHPSVLHSPDLPRIDAERVLVIVNQPPADERAGQPQYDLLACQAAARRQFGQTGSWLPIGPLVRKEIAGTPGMVGLADSDWNNIIDIDEWRVPR